uniref:Uncharacterized protein n=1 Tax=Anguilla anguilla TaxID=7936 RepID=A0A0E9WM24_ANGAN
MFTSIACLPVLMACLFEKQLCSDGILEGLSDNLATFHSECSRSLL